MSKRKVIIIGAGPAGLTAGYELLKDSNQYEVIILEESNEIGGIDIMKSELKAFFEGFDALEIPKDF